MRVCVCLVCVVRVVCVCVVRACVLNFFCTGRSRPCSSEVRGKDNNKLNTKEQF